MVADPVAKRKYEVDVIAVGRDNSILAIGEAKHTSDLRGIPDLERLERVRALLPPDHRSCRLLLFAANGFRADLRKAALRRQDVELIDLNRMYGK